MRSILCSLPIRFLLGICSSSTALGILFLSLDGVHAVQAYKVGQWPLDQWPSQAHLTPFILLVVEL